MQPILPTGNVPSTNVDGSHGADDPANMPAAKFSFVPAGSDNYPQDLNFFSWRAPGSPGSGS